MKINFTKKEYRLLLDIVYLGQWMVEAHKAGGPEEDDEYEMLAQKIYSYAKEMGCEELIKAEKRAGLYFPTREYEEQSRSHEIIDQYNDDTFWEELINRLADRDAHEDARAEGKKIESAEEFWKYSTPHEAKYAEEFEANGLKRLKLSEI